MRKTVISGVIFSVLFLFASLAAGECLHDNPVELMEKFQLRCPKVTKQDLAISNELLGKYEAAGYDDQKMHAIIRQAAHKYGFSYKEAEVVFWLADVCPQ